MKRLMITLFAIGISAISSICMATMSTGEVRKQARFLTDKMAYELNLNNKQYNDTYEINYDFIFSIRHFIDDAMKGKEWAIDKYYDMLDIRNDDLRWVLANNQYKRFMNTEYFYRPVQTSGKKWNLRVHFIYTNANHFYFPVPHHYNKYSGGNYRAHHANRSYYKGRYNHTAYQKQAPAKKDNVYHNNRKSDFNPASRPAGSANSSSRSSVGSSSSSRSNSRR